MAVAPTATAELGTLVPSDHTSYGWPLHVLLLVSRSFTPPVITLSGRDLHTGYTLWLTADTNVPNMPAPTPTVTIDPSGLNSFTSDGHWRIWFGVLYVPGAGCYTLQASWLAGGWTVHFAAGR